MIDELDLAFDEHAERGRPRHRRGARAGTKRSGKSAIAFVMAFMLLAVLGGGAYLGYSKIRGFFVAADYSGAGTDPVQVTIATGATLTDMGDTLVDADVVKSTKAFVNAADADPRGKNIQPGTYNLRKQMSAKNAVALLLDPKSRVSKGITIPEGKTMLQTFDLLSKATKIPVADFREAAKDPVALGVRSVVVQPAGQQAGGEVRGGLPLPGHLRVRPEGDRRGHPDRDGQAVRNRGDELGFADSVQKNLSISPFQALIVASLAQAEAGTPEDLSKIARVAYNRAYKARPPMPLQFDVTANYWIELNGGTAKHSGQLTGGELNDPKNPYNTVGKIGLPPGPIDNPGKAALQAAMTPAAGTWLYFVVIDKSGKSAFATTEVEHERNIQKACANGIPLCGK